MAGRVPEPEFLVVGQLSRPHGTKGEILVWPLTDRPDEVLGPGRQVVVGDEEGEAGEGAATLRIEASRPHRKGLLLKFEGVADRAAAADLTTRYLLVPAAMLPEDEDADGLFYHELLGLRVETVDGREVGLVREVFETEPSHLLEVKGEGKVHLVPFVSRVVKEVDREGGRLVIDPPEGLLDL
ncbi:MAG TPA: ribosome maturation factor RimM [Longimicrobiales bacterium]|nr:ribosome maturation factor RimM [Longimicrobiales bacterium]